MLTSRTSAVGTGGVASQLLQGREAAHAAAGGQAFFDEGLEVAPGGGDGDDDFIHAVVAGELEDVARPAHHGHAAELRAGADAVVVHHEHGRAVAVAAALHLMHDARAGPARAHHHHAAHVVARRAQEGEALVGDQNAVEKAGRRPPAPSKIYPKQQIDHPVQAKEVFGAHKDVCRQGKHIGEQRRHQRGQGDAQHVVCGGILPHRAVHAKGAEHQQKKSPSWQAPGGWNFQRSCRKYWRNTAPPAPETAEALTSSTSSSTHRSVRAGFFILGLVEVTQPPPQAVMAKSHTHPLYHRTRQMQGWGAGRDGRKRTGKGRSCAAEERLVRFS